MHIHTYVYRCVCRCSYWWIVSSGTSWIFAYVHTHIHTATCTHVRLFIFTASFIGTVTVRLSWYLPSCNVWQQMAAHTRCAASHICTFVFPVVSSLSSACRAMWARVSLAFRACVHLRWATCGVEIHELMRTYAMWVDISYVLYVLRSLFVYLNV